MNKYVLFLLLLAGGLWSCTDGELITPGDEFYIKPDPGTYDVKINGILSDFSQTTFAINSIGGSTITGNSLAGHIISITLSEDLAEGTYTEADGASIKIINQEGTYLNTDATGNMMPLTVTIKKVNHLDNWVTGEFSGEVYNEVSEEVRDLTQGRFVEILFEDVNVQNSILEADFNDQYFDFGSNAYATGIGTAAVITGFNEEQVQTLTMTVPGGIAEGETFTDAEDVLIEVSLDASGNPDDVYSNYDPFNDEYLPVSISINSITSGEGGRVTGTFSGQISKFNANGPIEIIEITNGEIDVPILTMP